MRPWFLITLAAVCNVAIIVLQPLFAQVDENARPPVFLTRDDIANVRNVFRTLKLTFEKRAIARIFGPDAAADITAVSISIKRMNLEIEQIEIVFRTFSEAEKTIKLDKQEPDFKTLADNIKWIENN